MRICMKTSEMIVVAGLLFLAWKMYKTTPGAATRAAWQYFPGGMAIDPNGAYYVNGQQVWTPASNA